MMKAMEKWNLIKLVKRTSLARCTIQLVCCLTCSRIMYGPSGCVLADQQCIQRWSSGLTCMRRHHLMMSRMEKLRPSRSPAICAAAASTTGASCEPASALHIAQ